jgi:hypothetical protein
VRLIETLGLAVVAAMAFGADSASGTLLPTWLSHTVTQPALIHANRWPLKRQAGSSGTCSEAATWSALYDLTPVDATEDGLSIHLKGR